MNGKPQQAQQESKTEYLRDIIIQLEVEKNAQGEAFKAYTELASEQVQAQVSAAAGFYSLLTTAAALLIWLTAGAPALPAAVTAGIATWILFNITRIYSGSKRAMRSRKTYGERVSWLL